MYKVSTTIKKVKKALKRIIPFSAHQLTIKYWPTKPYFVWLVIQFLLFDVKPKVLLELGSGRSSHYYAEFAEKESSDLISVEQNLFYYLKNKVGFNFSFLNSSYLHHIPLLDDWFNIPKLNQLINGRSIDFIMIDAPGGGVSSGSRNSLAGNKYLATLLSSVKILVIDDFQREEVYTSFNHIIGDKISSFDSFLIPYPTSNPVNYIGIFINKSSSHNFKEFAGIIDLKFATLETFESNVINKFLIEVPTN